MKKHLLKKEWETYIQDYKNSELYAIYMMCQSEY